MDTHNRYMYAGSLIDEDSVVQLLEEDFKKMKDRLRWLDSLEQAGVDNWEGISLAQDIYDTFN